MRIERLENSKHKQERVLVYLEDGTLLRITGAELLQFGLYQGLDLPPETLEELRGPPLRHQTPRRQHGLRTHAVQKGTDGAPDEKGRFTG